MRVPLIQFRYGLRSAILSAPPIVEAAKNAVSSPTQQPRTVFSSWRELPGRYRVPLSDLEIKTIRFGGAAPYEPPVKRAKQ